MKVTEEENQSLIAKSGKLTGIFGAGHAGLNFWANWPVAKISHWIPVIQQYFRCIFVHFFLPFAIYFPILAK